MAKKKTVRREAREEGKPDRVPLGGVKSKLQLSEADRKEFDRRGMVPRWINDDGGRLEAAKAGGYNYVDPKYATSLGAGVINQGNTEVGSVVSKIVTRASADGPAVKGYLMEIRKKYYDADQKLKEERNARVDQALHIGEREAEYGSGVTFSH